MEHSDNSFGFSPRVLLKFGDYKEFMDLTEILTPRAKTSLARPKSLPPPDMNDEDSGLGMDFDEMLENKGFLVHDETACLPQTANILRQSYSVRRSLFEKSKRLFDGDDDGSITKKPRQSQKPSTSSSRVLSKSLSFGNAENLFTHDHIKDLLTSRTCAEGERHILIFHCEFSSERGPKMFLRNKDRELNNDRYPFLNFPEVYLLNDGYKCFYQTHKELCEPMSYKPMLHENHVDDLRHFRSKSKSWCAGSKNRKNQRKIL
ncbi:uncharacterized protein LOC117339170 [Pecten maximus]|uniref:uncharacterized protein LOC117339170 n=1 Tax=Pecten maximus TaxID=6579 RepID=UPI001457FEC8|nr:uncharacterized protein LOC117339170 [Pecten maximus]